MHVSSKGERSMSNKQEGSFMNEMDGALEELCAQIRQLELEAQRRQCGRSHDRTFSKDSSKSSQHKRELCRSSPRLARDRSTLARNKNPRSLDRGVMGHPNVALDTMSKALRHISCSPFGKEIKRTRVPRHFVRIEIIIYNCKTDLVEYVSHFS